MTCSARPSYPGIINNIASVDVFNKKLSRLSINVAIYSRVVRAARFQQSTKARFCDARHLSKQPVIVTFRPLFFWIITVAKKKEVATYLPTPTLFYMMIDEVEIDHEDFADFIWCVER